MRVRVKYLLLSCLFFVNIASGQQKAENLVIVTLDGFRWQELFKGADEVLINDKTYTHDPKGAKEDYWAGTATARREKLLPFFWSTVVQNGQLHGNRAYGSKVNVLNEYQFSYPGYNELLTGYPDPAVNSNDKIWNKNETVLSFLQKQKEFTGKVAAFASWDVFPYILNARQGGVYVNADADSFKFSSPTFQALNELQILSPKPLSLRPDVVTYMAAKQYLKEFHPRVLFIGFDETDDFAHHGLYDQYLLSAHAQDAMLSDLWNYIQSQPQYKNKTTLIITCDHGRGDKIKKNWTDHGDNIKESGETWMAFLGAGIEPGGEIKTEEQLYQAQLAQTMAGLLGYEFKPAHKVEQKIALSVNTTDKVVSYTSKLP